MSVMKKIREELRLAWPLLGIVAFVLVVHGPLSSNGTEARAALERDGYTQIDVRLHWGGGCRKGENRKSEFTAVDKSGARVNGVVCGFKDKPVERIAVFGA